MNPFYFEDTPKELALELNQVTDQIIGDIFETGIRLITVNDSEFNDVYRIRLEKSYRFGISGLCFLSNRSSYQADFRNGTNRSLRSVINAIAGGEILHA
jgi:hypothetical protein